MTEPVAIAVTDLAARVGGATEVAAATHIGPVRTENQDAFAAVALPGGGVGVLVADGMGGLPGGGEAAWAAAAAAAEALATPGEPDVVAAVLAANRALSRLREGIGGHPGTTLTLAAVRGPHAAIGHAGDSRAYLVRDGAATVLTSDHSWVGERVRAGELSPGSERRHPRRNIITTAVMGDPIEPELVAADLRPGDLLLLCSDGFWEPLEDNQIAALLETAGPLTAVVERAVAAALDAGATDNVTLLALRVAC